MQNWRRNVCFYQNGHLNHRKLQMMNVYETTKQTIWKNKLFPWPIKENHLEWLISNFVIMAKKLRGIAYLSQRKLFLEDVTNEVVYHSRITNAISWLQLCFLSFSALLSWGNFQGLTTHALDPPTQRGFSENNSIFLEIKFLTEASFYLKSIPIWKYNLRKYKHFSEIELLFT